MADIRYSKDHEWIRRDGDVAIIGITDYAQNQLGDVVYVELPEIGPHAGRRGGEAAGCRIGQGGRERSTAPVAGEGRRVNELLSGEPRPGQSRCDWARAGSSSSSSATPSNSRRLMEEARTTRNSSRGCLKMALSAAHTMSIRRAMLGDIGSFPRSTACSATFPSRHGVAGPGRSARQ